MRMVTTTQQESCCLRNVSRNPHAPRHSTLVSKSILPNVSGGHDSANNNMSREGDMHQHPPPLAPTDRPGPPPMRPNNNMPSGEGGGPGRGPPLPGGVEAGRGMPPFGARPHMLGGGGRGPPPPPGGMGPGPGNMGGRGNGNMRAGRGGDMGGRGPPPGNFSPTGRGGGRGMFPRGMPMMGPGGDRGGGGGSPPPRPGMLPPRPSGPQSPQDQGEAVCCRVIFGTRKCYTGACTATSSLSWIKN